MLPAEEFAIHCGFAAARCGKASPYRGRVFNLREGSPPGDLQSLIPVRHSLTARCGGQAAVPEPTGTNQSEVVHFNRPLAFPSDNAWAKGGRDCINAQRGRHEKKIVNDKHIAILCVQG